MIIKAVYNMSGEQNDNTILKWNYNIIKLLKSINKEEAYTYKKFQLIDWQDVDTSVSKNGKGYIFLKDFGISESISRKILNGEKDSEDLKHSINNSQKYAGLKKFCEKTGIDLSYVCGEKPMAPQVKKGIVEDKNYNIYFAEERKSMVRQIIDYMNSHDESDPVNIWFAYFKNIDKIRFVSELKGLYRELDKLSYSNLIEYRRKNPAALKELYNRLSKAAVDVAMIYSGEENIREITRKFENDRKSAEQMEEADIDNILK